jgi:hypothetical protein
MKWRSLKEKKPVMGEYCFLKNNDLESIGIWTGKGFAIIQGEVPIQQDKWAPAFLKGAYTIRSSSGELNFIPKGIYDEDGNEWEPPK